MKPNQQMFTEEFEKYICKIRNSSPSTIDLDQFKTCSNDIRRNCTKILLEQVIANPANVELYIKLVLDIATSHSELSTGNPTFFMYLMDCCNHVMNESFKDKSTTPWSQINIL